MSTCKQCGKPIESIPGRKPREFCKETNCRITYWKKNNPKDKPKTIPLPKDFVEFKKVGILTADGTILEIGTPEAIEQFKVLPPETIKMYQDAMRAMDELKASSTLVDEPVDVSIKDLPKEIKKTGLPEKKLKELAKSSGDGLAAKNQMPKGLNLSQQIQWRIDNE